MEQRASDLDRSVGSRGRGKIGFWWGNRRERHHLQDVGVDGKIILK